MIVFPGQDHAGWAGGVGMRGADENRLRRDAALCADLLSGRFDCRAANDQRINTNQRNTAVPLLEHHRPNLARIMADAV